MTIEATPTEIAALIRELQGQPIQKIHEKGECAPCSEGNGVLHISEKTDCSSKIRLSVGNGNEGGIEYIPRTGEGIKRIVALIDSSVTEISIKKEPTPNAPVEKD